jgi:hypothetical protein
MQSWEDVIVTLLYLSPGIEIELSDRQTLDVRHSSIYYYALTFLFALLIYYTTPTKVASGLRGRGAMGSFATGGQNTVRGTTG